MLHFVLSSLENWSHYVRGLLLDYSKAFDSVNHYILLQKLHEAGSPAILTWWAVAFLLNGKLWWGLEISIPPWWLSTGGNPHGTLFGPMSFITHLGNFSTPSALDFIYVDDTSCCTASGSPASPAMQVNADYAALWARNNDMKLTAQKMLELVFSSAKKPAKVNPVVTNGQHMTCDLCQIAWGHTQCRPEVGCSHCKHCWQD